MEVNEKNLSIMVIGEPKAQPRPRAYRRGGHAAVYNPKTADAWKGSIKEAFIDYHGLKHPGRVNLTIRFTTKLPKSRQKIAGEPDTRKPDIDNLSKAVMDALTDCGLWCDDSQVVNLTASKTIASAGEPQSAQVSVTLF